MRLILVVSVLLVVSGCGGSAAPELKSDAAMRSPMPGQVSLMAEGRGAERGGEASPQAKIIRNGQLGVEVEDLDAAAAVVRSSVQARAGRIESATRIGDDSVHMRIRIPSEGLDPIMADVSALGRVLNRTVSESDVSMQYIDTEARLKTRLALRDRLQSLLETAESVEDILNIERELARVQGEIDAMQGQLNYLDRQVDESTLDVTLQTPAVTPPETKPGPLGYVFLGIWKAVKWLFVWEN